MKTIRIKLGDYDMNKDKIKYADLISFSVNGDWLEIVVKESNRYLGE